MSRKRIKDIAVEKNERVDNPSQSPYNIFVGLEHYDSGEATIRRFGSTEMLESTMKVFHAGDILVARRNVYLRRAAFVDFDGLTSGDSIVLHIENEAYRRIIPFVLNTDDFWNYANQHADGSMSKRLSPKLLMEYEFSLPDDGIDQLSDILWAMERVKNAYRELIARTDDLMKSQFIEQFDIRTAEDKGWPIMTLDQIADVGSSKRVFVKDLKTEGIPFFRGTEVGALAEGLKVNPELFITEQHYEELKKATGVAAQGDLLLPSICPDGRIWQVDTLKPFYFKDGRVLWIHPDQSIINSTYLRYALKAIFADRYNEIASGTTFAELKIFALKSIKLAIPPKEQQEEYSAFVEQSDKSKFATQQTLKELTDAQRALMKNAFS